MNKTNTTNKLSMTKDSFVFSVHQAYVGRMKSNGIFDSHLRFEPFLDGTWKREDKPSLLSFKKELTKILEHHFNILPNYRRNEVVDLENISWFAHSIAVLFADMEKLLLAYTGHGFPVLTTASIPHATNSKNIAFAIKKYADFGHKETEEKYSLFPLIDDQENQVDEFYIQELWSLIAFLSKRVFGEYSVLITSYIEWKYADKSVEKEVIDWNVRPPCGAAYRREFKELFEEERNNRRFGNSGGRDRERKDTRNNAASSTENRAPNNSSHSDDKKEKVFETKERPSHPKSNFRDRNRFKDKEPHIKSQAHIENLNRALEETKAAVEKMKQDKDILEISLKPQNSFVRREQHMIISQAGFGTESRGDDQERCVCIVRNK